MMSISKSASHFNHSMILQRTQKAERQHKEKLSKLSQLAKKRMDIVCENYRAALIRKYARLD